MSTKLIIIRNPKRAWLWIGTCCAVAFLLGFAVYYESTLQKTYRLYMILLWSPIGLWALGHLVAIWYDDRRFSFSGGLVASALLTSIEHAIIYLVATLNIGHNHTPEREPFAVLALFSVLGFFLFFLLFTPIFYLFRDIRTYADAEKCAN